MTPTEFRRALAARCDTTRTRYARWNAAAGHNDPASAPLPDPPPKQFGIYPIAPGDDKTRIGVLDFDNHDDPPLPWEEVVALARPVVHHLREIGHRPFPFRSRGGKGINVWLAWDELQPAFAVRATLIDALEANGMESGGGGIRQRRCEVFPKQEAVPEDGWGNCIDPPLAGESCPLDPDTLSPVDEIPLLVTSRPVPRDRPPEEPQSQRAARATGAEWYPWDETRIRSALDAIPADEYDDWIIVLRALKGGAKRKQRPDGDARALAEAWSQRSAKHDARGFDRKWERAFPKEQAGRGRGLGSLFWLAENKYEWVAPEPPCCVERIVMQDSDPAIFLVTVHGREIAMEAGDLMSPKRLTTKILNTIGRMVIPPKREALDKILAEAEHIEADEHSCIEGQFKQHLLRFLDEAIASDKAELKLTGRAWWDDTAGRSWFKMSDLTAWLTRERHFEVGSSLALHYVRKFGGNTAVIDIGNGVKQRAWYVPLNPRENAHEPTAAVIHLAPRVPF